MKHYLISNRDTYLLQSVNKELFFDEWGNDEYKMRYAFYDEDKGTPNITILPYLSGDKEEEQIVQYTNENAAGYTEGSQKFFIDLFEDIKNSAPEKNKTLIVIHGHNVSVSKSVEFIRKLHERYILPAGSPVKRILFYSWPSNVGVIHHEKSANRTAVCATAFRIFYKKLSQFGNQYVKNYYHSHYTMFMENFSLMTQSMGNMILSAFVSHLDYPPGANNLCFQELFMMAADIDYRQFEKKHPLNKIEKIAKRVHVYFKNEDMALDNSKFWCTLTDRMGEKGPFNKKIKPGIVYSIDINNVNDLELVELGDSHRYFLTSKIVSADVLGVFDTHDLSGIAGRHNNGESSFTIA